MLNNNFKFTNFQAKGITSIILFIIISIALFFRLEVFDGIIVNELKTKILKTAALLKKEKEKKDNN